jgi:formylglycine-generating enzyme required for sulfatase activity
MRLPLALLKVVGKGVLNAVGGGIAGDVVCDVLPEVARDVCAWWKKGRTPEEQRAEVRALAQASPAEVREAVREVVADLAAGRPPEVQKALELYLSQVPGAVRQSLRRPADPAGLSLPVSLALDEPDDVLPLLPAHLPRFQAGDRPLPGIDWELVELLGAGGFGEVWKARNPHFDAVPPVALKFCLDPAAKDRLLRHEAAILNQVMRQGKHPGIVALQHTYLSADPPCLEYEYVEGGDLAGLLNEWRHDPPGPERAARVARLVLDLARTVGFAHRLDPPIVHRDLKPANILVQRANGGRAPSEEYRLWVADFGIGGVAAGQALAPARRNVSQGQFLVTALRGAHTPLYASPQQMRGRPPDPRDDVYSLGVIWYQLATSSLVAGRPGGTRWTQRLAGLGVPAAQVELLGACVEEEPTDRPADAAALADQLAALLGAAAPKPDAAAPAPAPSAAPATAPAAVSGTPVEAKCPDCGGPMLLRVGKRGPFLGCAAFPACRGTRGAPHELRERALAEAGAAPAAPTPPAVASTITNSIGMKLVLVPAGTFLMGSPDGEDQRADDEGPQRRVRMTRPFYLGAYPVTQRQYEEVMGDNPSQFGRSNGGGADHPVEQVSWHDAVLFCRRLSARPAERKAARAYRLPTEAEWEYACRAGTQTASAFGDALSGEQANFDGNHPYGRAGRGPHRRRTSKAGAYSPNAWGLYDMHGNVWEWCDDWYAEGHYAAGPQSNPPGPPSGSQRVLRGGSWNNSGHLCRSARRNKYAPDFRGDTIGFRVAVTA